ncbi:MAG: hypothetical protein HOH14_10570 [Gammaproteobacteria bacterium]|jgi:hypothetical protein|nr:hypothetical protein [Gammaproteobacteria bacterium]
MSYFKKSGIIGYAGLVLLLIMNSVYAQPGFKMPTMPAVEQPPGDFASADEHYAFLLAQANGGTQHTIESLPQWTGLWSMGLNTTAEIFFEETDFFLTLGPGGTVREGVLTPAYEQQFRERRAEIDQYGEQLYDRLTNCEYPGVPRWIWEPYVKEFVHMPNQTWMMNDMMNETRRIYIGQEHKNIDGTHSSTGDSIGFWDGDKLVISTMYVNPADYARNMPLTSNQFSMVETWQQETDETGAQILVTQVTFYDPLALVEPQSAVYLHTYSAELEEAGLRVRNWECSTSSNSYKDENGSTMFYLPGDPEYKDPRGYTDFPDLPGQSKDPIFDAQ